MDTLKELMPDPNSRKTYQYIQEVSGHIIGEQVGIMFEEMDDVYIVFCSNYMLRISKSKYSIELFAPMAAVKFIENMRNNYKSAHERWIALDNLLDTMKIR